MSAPTEKDTKSRRSRIVINVDDARRRNASDPRHTTRAARVLIIFALIIAALVLGAVVGGYFWWQNYKTRPAYSLALLVDAAQRNDTAAFDEIVDTDKIIDNLVPQVIEEATKRYASSLTVMLRRRVASLIPGLLPNIKQNVRDEVMKEIRQMSGATGRSVFLTALALPYAVDIKEEGDTAKATAKINNRPIELMMQRGSSDSGRWRVVGVKDDALAGRIVDSITKDLVGR